MLLGRGRRAFGTFVSDPGGLPEGAIGYVDFANLTFYDTMGSEDIDQVIENDPDNGWPYDPENLQEGVGLVGNDADTRPSIIGTWLAQILEGATMVFDCTFSDGVVTNNDHLTFFAYDSPDFNFSFGGTVAPTPSSISSNVYAGGGGTAVDDVTAGRHLVAVTVGSGVGKICHGGGTVFTATPTADWPSVNAAGIEIYLGNILHSATIYPIMTNAEMQAATA